MLLYQVVLDGTVICKSAACCSSDDVRRVAVGLLSCVGSCMVLLALRAVVRVAGPSKVKIPGKRDHVAHLCSFLLFLPCQVSGCAAAAILRVYGQNVCVGLAAAACGAFLLGCILVVYFCSDELGPFGEHGCHVTALGTLGSDTSAGFTVTGVMVLVKDLCRWPGECGHVLGLHLVCAACPGECGHVLGLRVAAATVCAACCLICFPVGDCWILGGVFWLLSAGVHSGPWLAAACEVSAAAAAAAASENINGQPGVCKGVSVYALDRQRRQHGWTCQRPPNDKDKWWSSKKKKSEVSRSSCALSRVVTTSCLALPICSLLIYMNKSQSCVICLVKSSCWFTEAKLSKGLALWENGVYRARCDAHFECKNAGWHPASLASFTVPCAIGVGAGTPKRGASGVEQAVRRVRPF